MKTKKSSILRLLRMAGLVGATAALVPTTTQAVVLSLDPVAQTIDVGDTAVVNLNVSGLGVDDAPFLGAWLAWINFNGAIVSITAGDVSFGSMLDLGIIGSLQGVDDTGAGVVKADEISFEAPADLDAMQPDAFTLATFEFLGIGIGTTQLTLWGPPNPDPANGRPQLGDENGFSFLDENGEILLFQIENAEITVRGGPDTHGVPDAHATGICLVLGLGLLALVRRLRG